MKWAVLTLFAMLVCSLQCKDKDKDKSAHTHTETSGKTCAEGGARMRMIAGAVEEADLPVETPPTMSREQL